MQFASPIHNTSDKTGKITTPSMIIGVKKGNEIYGNGNGRGGMRTLPTEGAILGGGATSFSRSSLAIRWWSVPTVDVEVHT